MSRVLIQLERLKCHVCKSLSKVHGTKQEYNNHIQLGIVHIYGIRILLPAVQNYQLLRQFPNIYFLH